MTITNTKYTGRTLYLMVETSPGVYAQVGGMRTNSFSIGVEEIDVTDKDDDLWKKLLGGGNRTISASGSGFITNNAAYEAAQAAAQASTGINAKLVYKTGKAIIGLFFISSLELSGEYNGAQMFSASLSSMNTPYIGIAGAVPTLDLQFAETGSLQPSIGAATAGFTRSTAGLYRDVDGYLKSAAINVQRFEHDSAGNRMGYLPEPASTNLLTFSQVLENAAWTKTNVTVVANAAVAPDQTATADLVYPSSTGSGRTIYNAISGSVITYASSIFVKAAGLSWVYLIRPNGVQPDAWFNVSTGVLGTVVGGMTASIEPYKDGYYRITLIGVGAATTYLQLGLSDADNSQSVTTSGTNGVYLWGGQLEAQPQNTSYIVTTTASASRGGDVLTYTGITGLSTTEGALVVEYYQAATDASNGAVAAAINDGTGNERALIYRELSNGNATAAVFDGGVGQASLSGSAQSLGSIARTALGFKVNDFAASFQGAAAVTDVSGTMFTPDRIDVGHQLGTLQNGRPIKRVTYYATKPSNADIVALAA